MKKFYYIFLFLFSVNANAWTTGEQLLNDCNSSVKMLNNDGYSINDFIGAGRCAGYLAATADLFGGGSNFCPPPQYTYSQLIRVTSKYLNAHPEDINMPAGVLVIAALKQAFPCLKNTKDKDG